MGLLARIVQPDSARLSLERGPLVNNWLQMLAGQKSATGKTVTAETSLQASVVFTCVRVLAESIASLPLPVYRRLSRGRARAEDHPLYTILHDAPNQWMTSYTFRETMVGHVCLWGNAFAQIERNRAGRVTELFPLRPDRMARPTVSRAGTLVYEYTLPDGEKKLMPADAVLHLRGLGSDGLWGYSPIGLAREQIGLNLALEEYSGRFFGNSARPTGVLQVEGKLTPDAAKNLSMGWNAAYQGLENSHKVAVLEEGVKWQSIGIPMQDSQFLEQRRYTRQEIAGLYRIPPHMVGDVDRSTSWGTGIEQQTIGFVVYCLRSWLVNIEQQLTMALLLPSERKTYFVKHVLDGLLRGDSAARGQFYQILHQIGALSSNDIRELEDMNPIDGGDEYFVMSNMMPLSRVDDVIDAQIEPKALPEPQAQNDEPRSFRSLSQRRRYREIYHAPIKELVQRAVEKEAAAIRANSESIQDRYSRVWPTKHPESRAFEMSFLTWLDTYHTREFEPWFQDALRPLLQSYQASVQQDVLDDMKIPRLADQADGFVDNYSKSFVKAYRERSAAQLRKLLRDGGPEEALELLEKRLEEWISTRSAKVADIESVRAGEAFAHDTYKRAGVRRLRWTLVGPSTCNFCKRLDGKIVGIQEPFLSEGSTLEGGEGDEPMKVRGSKLHAPIHRGCNCQVEPV